MAGISISAPHAIAFSLIALAGVLISLRHRIEDIPVQLFPKPALSGPGTPAVTTLAIVPPGSAGVAFPVDVWMASKLPARDAASAIPVVIYVPGWGNARSDNALLCAELASHGFAVIALDDISVAPSADPAVRARDTAPFDLSSNAAFDRSNANAAWRLQRMTARVSQTIDWLGASKAFGTPRSMQGDFDSSRVAVIGFSFGGSVAAEVSRLDGRVAAAINMDGWLLGTSAQDGTQKPLLVFNSDYPGLQADSMSTSSAKHLTARLTIADRAIQVQHAAHGLSLSLLFRGTDHGDFSDELFAPPLGAYLERWRRTAADRLRVRRSMERLILGFLDGHLIHSRTELLALDEDMSRSGIEILAAVPWAAVQQ